MAKPQAKDVWKFPVSLPSGLTVQVEVRHTQEVIQRKVKVQTGVRVLGPDWTVPVMRSVRDAAGERVTAPVKVRGLQVAVYFPDGHAISARSCCKAPDVFQPTIGKKRALARLFQTDSGTDVRTKVRNPEAQKAARLSGDDRRALFVAVLNDGESRRPRVKPVPAPAGAGGPAGERAAAAG